MGGNTATWFDPGVTPYPAAVKYLVVVVLLLAGCAAGSPAVSPYPSASGPRPITRLTVYFGPSDSPRSGQLEITTDGVRSRTRHPGSAGRDELELFDASDGTTHVRCDSMGCLRFEVLPGPASGTGGFESQCPNGRQTGTGEFVGRRTTIWACTPDGGEPTEAVFDAEFPDTMLRATLNAGYHWEAESFEVGVQVPPDFFSIDRPGLKWVKPSPTGVTPPKPGGAGAVLPVFGGGTMRMTDHTRGPALIVIGGEDELRGALARIERVRSGSLPKLVGVLQLPSGPGDYLPKQPFGVPVAIYDYDRDGESWLDMTGGQRTPVAVFCRAAGKGCTAIAVPELSDAALASEIAALA